MQGQLPIKGMKKIVYIVLLCCLPMMLLAESKEMRAVHPNELRIGYGDPLFETAAYYASMHRDYTFLSPNYTYTERQHYRYTGHIMAEYQYRLNHWFGVGGQVDFSEFFWDNVSYMGGSNDPVNIDPQNCYNIAVMPSLRFTWVHNYYFDMYSGIALGAIINGGTEKNDAGKTLAFGFAADVALVGVTFGTSHVYGGLEVGGLFGMQSLQTLFLVDSRILTASFGIRF